MTSEDRDPQPGSRFSRVRARRLSRWQEATLLLGVALVLAVVVKALLVQAFYIPSASMEPGLVENDRILVEKPSYWRGGPERGDVVVFEDAGGWLPAQQAPSSLAAALSRVGLYPTGGHLVKRVIGVAGDVIRCCDDRGRLAVNGQPLEEEDYARLDGAECYGPMPGGAASCDWRVGPVPTGKLFVMGDNRRHSGDSSVHACLGEPTGSGCDEDPYVDVDDVVGRVFLLAWPVGRFGFPTRPATFDDVPDAS